MRYGCSRLAAVYQFGRQIVWTDDAVEYHAHGSCRYSGEQRIGNGASEDSARVLTCAECCERHSYSQGYSGHGYKLKQTCKDCGYKVGSRVNPFDAEHAKRATNDKGAEPQPKVLRVGTRVWLYLRVVNNVCWVVIHILSFIY